MKVKSLALLVAAIALFARSPAVAADVSAADAALVVRNWLGGKSPLGCRLGGSVRDVRTVCVTNGASFHVVRMEGGGYAVVSSDTRLEPVVAFSSDGDVAEETGNPLWTLLRNDAVARRGRMRPGLAVDSRWKRLLAAPETAPGRIKLAAGAADKGADAISDVRVPPLLSSTWGQEKIGSAYCYNYYTPKHYPCGCVATTGAQIMRYFEWPLFEMPVAPFVNDYCCITGVEKQMTSIGGVFQWSSMPLVPLSSIRDDQCREIGRLTSDIGIICCTDYDGEGSGTPLYMLEKAFAHFGYSNSVSFESVDGIGAALVERILISNLDAGLPVALGMNGVDAHGYEVDHSVVGDGYGYSNGTLYFHFNIGWNGSGDLWYASLPYDLDGQVYKTFTGAVYNIYTNQTPGASIVSGRVTDAAGSPIAGATVKLESSDVNMVVHSNSRGIYSFIVPPGTYSVSASYGGISTTSHTVSPTECRTMKLAPYGGDYGKYYTSSSPSVGNVCECDFVVNDVKMVETPVISPAGGEFSDEVEIGVSCSTPGAVVRYTVDGTDPDETSPVFDGSIALKKSFTLKVRAFADGFAPSMIERAFFHNSSIGSAMDASDLVWTTSPNCPCFSTTGMSLEGLDCVRTGTLEEFHSSWIETVVDGPRVLSFFYRTHFVDGSFAVTMDDEEVFIFKDSAKPDPANPTYYFTDETWYQKQLEIPAGSHRVRLRFDFPGGKWWGVEDTWVAIDKVELMEVNPPEPPSDPTVGPNPPPNDDPNSPPNEDPEPQVVEPVVGVATVGEYVKWPLVDLGVQTVCDAEAAGLVYDVKIASLPSGLKLKYNAAVKNKKKVIVAAKTNWWIEGVPTAATDTSMMPIYISVTVNKKTTVGRLDISVADQKIADLGILELNSQIVTNVPDWLPGTPTGWTVAGLPGGLKFTAKAVYADKKKKKLKYPAYSVYGKTTVPGEYTIKASKKTNGYSAFRRYRITVPHAEIDGVVFPGLIDRTSTVGIQEPVWNVQATMGKIKSVSGLPAGFKFTAKKQTVSGTPTKAGTFFVKFVKTVKKKDRTAYIKWKVLPNPVSPKIDFNDGGGAVFESITQGTAYAAGGTVFKSFTGTDGVKVSATGMPKGMKLVGLADGSVGFVGAPSSAGVYFITVTATRYGKSVSQRIAVNVLSNPVAGTYRGFAFPGGKPCAVTISVKADGSSTLSVTESGVKCTAKAKSAIILEQDAADPRRGRYALEYQLAANKKKKLPARVFRVEMAMRELGTLLLPHVESVSFTRKDNGAEYAVAEMRRALTAAEATRLQTDEAIGAIPPICAFARRNEHGVILATAKWNASSGAFTIAGRLPAGTTFSGSSPLLLDGGGGIGYARFALSDADKTKYYDLLFTRRDFDIEFNSASLPPASLASLLSTLGGGSALMVSLPDMEGFPVLLSASYTPKTKKKAAVNYVRVSYDDGATWAAKVKATWTNGRLQFTSAYGSNRKLTFDLVYDIGIGGFRGWTRLVQTKKSGKKTVTVLDVKGAADPVERACQ